MVGPAKNAAPTMDMEVNTIHELRLQHADGHRAIRPADNPILSLI